MGGMRRAILIALVAALAAMPLLNALPADKPLHVSDFLISITGEWLCYAILALSIDLAWGSLSVCRDPTLNAPVTDERNRNGYTEPSGDDACQDDCWSLCENSLGGSGTDFARYCASVVGMINGPTFN